MILSNFIVFSVIVKLKHFAIIQWKIGHRALVSFRDFRAYASSFVRRIVVTKFKMFVRAILLWSADSKNLIRNMKMYLPRISREI